MATPDIVFSYLKLPFPILGRGGATRVFMLAHKIKFTEDNFDFPEGWMAAKAALAEEAVKHAPFMVIDGKKYTEHIPLMKLAAGLAKIEGPTDPFALYALDGIADAYAEWRAAWAKAKFSGVPGAEEEYKKDLLPGFLKEFETLLKKFSMGDPFICGATPYWTDAALFGLMSDNIVTDLLTEEGLKDFPKLLALYESFRGIKEVAEWFEKK